MMDITGLDKARVLKALWDHSMASMVQAMCAIFGVALPEMSIDAAREIIDNRKSGGGNLYFDYVNSRLIKTDLGSNFIDLSLYYRDNGYKAGENAILDEFTRPE